MIVGFAGAIFYSDVGSERIIPEQLEILQMSLIIAYAVIGRDGKLDWAGGRRRI